MLVEGMTNGGERPHDWKDFSGAMIRHAVDEAMRELPVQDKQVVKLAYFGGFSNREIAEAIGLTKGEVQRRLRTALASISDYIQHGRSFGRRAMYALTAWLSARWLSDAGHHAVQAVAVMSVTAIVLTHPAPAASAPRPATPVLKGHSVSTPALAAAPAAAPSVHAAGVPAAVPAAAAVPAVPALPAIPALPAVRPPALPLPALPALPSPPIKVKLPV